MAENRRRHPREYVNEPATIQVGGETYQGTITNISESGAAVEFVMGKGEDSVGFDIASRIEIDSETLGHLTGGDDGQVIRHYDGGFVFNFDGYRVDKEET